MSRMIKLTLEDTDKSSDYEHLPEDWDSMTEVDQESYLETCASDFVDNSTNCSAEVVQMEDE